MYQRFRLDKQDLQLHGKNKVNTNLCILSFDESLIYIIIKVPAVLVLLVNDRYTRLIRAINREGIFLQGTGSLRWEGEG